MFLAFLDFNPKWTMKKNNETEVEIDLNIFEKELLIELIIFAHKNDLTFNQTIVLFLQNFLKSIENKWKL